MKKLILSACIVACAFTLKAQVMSQKAAWVTISVPQMKCWVCKDKLEKFLFNETSASGDPAVLQVKVNMFNATVRIQYVPERTNPDYLRTEIANAGYDADSIKATVDSYKQLPPACKRKEEGGGPQKGAPCNVDPNQR